MQSCELANRGTHIADEDNGVDQSLQRIYIIPMLLVAGLCIWNRKTAAQYS